jgi:hypothetical protein
MPYIKRNPAPAAMLNIDVAGVTAVANMTCAPCRLLSNS